MTLTMYRCALLSLVLAALGCHAETSDTKVVHPKVDLGIVEPSGDPALVLVPDQGPDMADVDMDAGVLDAGVASRFEPISEEALIELKKIQRDPRPESLTQGHHYVTSDEYAHYLFRDALDDLGGTYVGLGTDQNYFLAGWSKPDVMVLLDFDQYVVDAHAVYEIIFKRSENIEAFLAAWSSKGEAEVVEAIAQAYPDSKRQKRLTKIYTRHRKRILRRLKFTQSTCAMRGVKTFLDDPEQYAHIAGLWREGRVFAVRGDLTADKAMAGLARWAKKYNQEITTLYLSNAEYYFPFETGSYVSNITGLPMGESSVVVHTFPRSKKFYKYVYEYGPTYQTWVKSGKAADMRELIRRSTRRVEPQLYFMAKMPDKSEPFAKEFAAAEANSLAREQALADPELATVKVTASPNGFLVIDNLRVGVVTPGQIRLPAGKHKLRIKFETGELSDEQEVELRKGQKASLKFVPPGGEAETPKKQ